MDERKVRYLLASRNIGEALREMGSDHNPRGIIVTDLQETVVTHPELKKPVALLYQIGTLVFLRELETSDMNGHIATKHYIHDLSTGLSKQSGDERDPHWLDYHYHSISDDSKKFALYGGEMPIKKCSIERLRVIKQMIESKVSADELWKGINVSLPYLSDVWKDIKLVKNHLGGWEVINKELDIPLPMNRFLNMLDNVGLDTNGE